MTEVPFVSVIMPIYNTELYVADAINSVLQQTFDNFELICVDDGSTDQSRAICEGLAENDGRMMVISQANGGQGNARNNALEKASG